MIHLSVGMAKHYIYEIFGKKIGATQNIARRMMQQSVKEGEYRVIEEHTNAKTASYREIELQKEYNYPVDKQLYWKTLKNQNKVNRKEIASKIDWAPIKAKVDWNTAFKTNRTPKIDYKKLGDLQRDKPKHTKEHIEKMYKTINQYDLEGNFIKQWNSIKEAEQFYNPNKKSQDNIGCVCRGKQKTAYKHKWEYAN